ncbi:MAG TPA: phosphoribosylformylglycinamidine synthase subunit PurQ [Candidatus Dormibacteraeota bacterium]|nr:phosphoribosylformylglycinamidine synthase subunit PurQ [Candidatus Dormibacteraeota bacterium]
MKFGIAVFPGTWSDRDCAYAAQLSGQDSVMLWHKDRDLQGADCVVLPGGFSYGDHLRAGAMARFSPLMDSVIEFAQRGGLVWGICNGFQILCEAHLLPGALTRNASLEFRCEPSWLRVDNVTSPFTSSCAQGEILEIPVSHGEGRYVADETTVSELQRTDRIAFTYVRRDGAPVNSYTPNGSVHDIAGILNESKNVLGMMPHPERASEPLLGSADGLRLFQCVAALLDGEGVFLPVRR